MDIKFNVDNTVLTRVDDTPLVEGTMNYLYAVFEFTAEWDNMPKTVVFSHEDELEQVILKDDKCLIPTEIIKPTQFEVTVYSGNKLITNKYTVNVYTNYPEHPPEPTPNVYEQIVTWIHNLENRVTIVELNIIHGGGVIDLVGLYPVAPEAGVDGQYYFNTLENKLYQYAVDRWMENATMLSKNRLYVTPSDGFVYYYDEPTISPITSMSELKFEVVDELPEFPQGGINGLMRYLTQHIRYPLIAQKNRIQGRVLCQFIVNADGSIADVQVLSGVHPALNTEAQRVLRAMPRWKPGKREGKPVRVRYTLPVEFRLQ